MIIVVPFSLDEPTKASSSISVTAEATCICPPSPLRLVMGYVAERRASWSDPGQAVSPPCQEEARPPVPCGSPSRCQRRRGGRYSAGGANYGWHHEPV